MKRAYGTPSDFCSVLLLVALIGWVDADFPRENLRLRRDEFHFTRCHGERFISKPPKTCCGFAIPCTGRGRVYRKYFEF